MRYGETKRTIYALLNKEFFEDIFNKVIAIQPYKVSTCNLEGRKGLKMVDRVFTDGYIGRRNLT